MRRWLKLSGITLSAIVLLFVVLAGAIYLTLSSEKGSRWLLDKALPGAHYQQFSGNLVKGINLTDLSLTVANTELSVSQLESRWRLSGLIGGELPVTYIRLGSVTVSPPPPQTAVDTAPAPWPSITLPFNLTVKEFSLKHLELEQGEDSIRLDNIALSLWLSPFQARITRFEFQQGEDQYAARAVLATRPPYQGDISFNWQHPLDNGIKLSGQGTVKGSLEQVTLKHELLSPAPVATTASLKTPFDIDTMSLNTETLRFSLNNQWQQAPLTPLAPFISSGEVVAEGSLDHYQMKADLSLTPTLQPENTESPLATLYNNPWQLVAQGTGNRNGLDGLTLDISGDKLQLHGEGDLDWQEGLQWHALLDLVSLDTSLLHPDVAGSLTANLTSQGLWREEQYDITANIVSLTGTLFDKPLQGQGALRLKPGLIEVDALQLLAGDNQLNADIASLLSDGQSSLNGNWILHAPRLDQLLPGLSGTLDSTGNIAGPLAKPAITVSANATNLAFQDWQGKSLSLTLSQDPNSTIKLALTGDGIALAPEQNITVAIKGDGTHDNHRLNALLTEKDSELMLAVNGAYKNHQWLGTVENISTTHPTIGHWQLQQPAALSLSSDAVTLATTCLLQDQASICGDLQKTPAGLASSVNLNQLSLESLAPLLSEDIALNGMLSGTGQWHRQGASSQGSFSLSVPEGVLEYRHPGQEATESQAFNLIGNGTWTTTDLSGELDLHLNEAGSLHAEVSDINPSAKTRLAGKISGNFTNLHWLDAFFPELEALDGQASLNLQINGDVQNPIVGGDIGLKQLTMDIPSAGISLEEGELAIEVADNRSWRLAGGIHSGPGKLLLSGEGRMAANWLATGRVELKGEDFLVVDLFDQQLQASPDLQLEMSTTALSLSGNLVIPKGHIYMAATPQQAVTVSTDEEIYPTPTSTRKLPRRPLSTDLMLDLGDKVYFRGFGLDSRLSGRLTLQQSSGHPARGKGTIHLRDASYSAYGQNLKVDKGQLIFQGPLDNPGLNIRALRNTKYATVGIQINGFARDIQSELFSNPSQSSTDTLSILMTGRPLADASADDASLMMNAAAGLGIANSGWLTGRIQNTFGLDEVKLQGGENYEDSGLVVGKYLTPDLFVSYVQNLFTPQGSVQLDYSLSDHLGLKATSGEKQTIDLLYKIEH